MKAYELMSYLEKMPAGADVLVAPSPGDAALRDDATLEIVTVDPDAEVIYARTSAE